MILISNERWKVAQAAEKKYSQMLEKIPLLDKSQFFSRNFNLDKKFLNGQTILEVGYSPMAENHFIEYAKIRVGIILSHVNGKISIEMALTTHNG